MKNAKRIIRDLKHLKGNKIFGYYDTVNQKESKNLEVSAFDIIRCLAEYEIDFKKLYGVSFDTDEANNICEEIDGDNSYNWNSQCVFTFGKVNMLIEDKTYTYIRFHRYGDVRCNYTYSMVLDMTVQDMLIEIFENCTGYASIDYKGHTFEISQNPIDECCVYRVYCDDLNIDDDHAVMDIDNDRVKKDIKKGLVKYLKEEYSDLI